MRPKITKFIGILSAILSMSLLGAEATYAQPRLVIANPEPDSILNTSPTSVTLTFDHTLSDQGTWIAVTDVNGARFDERDGHVNPANRYELVVTIPLLSEGEYRVAYNAVSVGGSTITVGRYFFKIDLPEPVLTLRSPTNSTSFTESSIVLEMETQFFDFDTYNNRIRVYVNGGLDAEIQALNYTVTGLSPGVHEIKTVLAQFEDEELTDTANLVYIAIAQPDEELQGREEAAAAAPDAGLSLTTRQWTISLVLTLLLLVSGILLGIANERRLRNRSSDQSVNS